jgi:hypothetical protein
MHEDFVHEFVQNGNGSFYLSFLEQIV